MAFKLPSSWKVFAFTFNLLCGLAVSQIIGAFLDEHTYHTVAEVIQALTMWALSYIMINVGYEFTIDKNALAWYGWDYLIAMTAAGFPWLFVALWFLFTLDSMKVDEAFLVARFAAPTSAGILFSMLEAAGLRETWVFQKARILAIFDDLDTILLMIPLKIVMMGFKWELLVVIGIMVALLSLTWWKLHSLRLPFTWQWTLLYAAVVSAVCKLVHHITHHHIDMDPIHIEVLLPAFVIGCIIDTPIAKEELEAQRKSLEKKLTKKISNSSTSDIKVISVIPASSEKQEQSTWADPVDNSHCKWEIQPSDYSTSAGDCSNLDIDSPKWFMHDIDTPQVMEVDSSMLVEDIEVVDVPNQVVVDCGRDSHCETAKHQAPTSPPYAVVASAGYVTEGLELQKPPPVESSKGSAEAHSHLATNGALHTEAHDEEGWEHEVNTTISMVFMVLVGLSMPALVGKNSEDSNSSMGQGMIALHVAMVTLLMIIGKMFPSVCYRDEASARARLALCLGMCPRGEVGASIIVISLDLGISGPAIIISMCSLVINLVMSGAFIGSVKLLLKNLDLDGDGVIDNDEWSLAEKQRKDLPT